MRAVFIEKFGQPKDLILRQAPPPKTGPAKVLVDVHAIGVNFPDLLVTAGTYQDLFPLPFVPGKEAAGTVREIGEGVEGFEIGDRVSLQVEAGAYAEQVAVWAGHCYHIPDAISLIDAAALGLAYQTAYFALTDRAGVKPGDWVLVTGAAGGVGLAALQLAKAQGARVIAGLGSASKEQFVRLHGADAVVDLSRADLLNDLRDEVRRITNGRGCDIVIDQVGGASFDACLRTLSRDGRLVVTGFASGLIPSVRANYLLMKHISVMGMHWGRYRDGDPARVETAQQEIFRLMSSGLLRSPVMVTYPLEFAADALAAIADRRVLGKLVLTTHLGRSNAMS